MTGRARPLIRGNCAGRHHSFQRDRWLGGHPTPYASSGQLATASQTKTERLERFALAPIIYGLVNEQNAYQKMSVRSCL